MVFALLCLAWLRSPPPLASAASPLHQAPTNGNEVWGRWSHANTDISIDLLLDDNADWQTLEVEVNEGWLFVGSDLRANKAGNVPLLYGRFAQPVRADELSWTCDTCEVWDAKQQARVNGQTARAVHGDSQEVVAERHK